MKSFFIGTYKFQLPVIQNCMEAGCAIVGSDTSFRPRIGGGPKVVGKLQVDSFTIRFTNGNRIIKTPADAGKNHYDI